jgi:hypothetical protein
MTEHRLDMPPHWFADEIENAVMTRNSTQIARTCGMVIANSAHIRQVIDTVIEADGEKISTDADLTHTIRQAIAREIGQYPGLHDEPIGARE